MGISSKWKEINMKWSWTTEFIFKGGLRGVIGSIKEVLMVKRLSSSEMDIVTQVETLDEPFCMLTLNRALIPMGNIWIQLFSF